jgi:2-(1,2-epoxy-1,2-dihydrophenyl)acetyl-CoA isomerase
MVEDHLLSDRTAGVLTVTLNRPDRLNAFTTAMTMDLHELLRDASADPEVRCVVITGAGRAFCAGQDLQDRAVTSDDDEPPNLYESLEERYNPIVRSIAGMPKPVIASVNGVAAGAGANLALACDLVYAAQSAKFIQAFSRIGLIPDSGGTWTLPRLVGSARAMGLSLLAEPLSAERAVEWGMIWAVVDDAELTETVAGVARNLAAGPTLAYTKLKDLLGGTFGRSLDDQLDVERDTQDLLGRSTDYREGVRAFFDKRSPKFTGS